MKPEVLKLSAVQVGDEIFSASETATNLSTFLVCIAWWASHRIHYDLEEARREGFNEVVVPGMHLYAWIEKLLVNWTGNPACIRRIKFRHVSLPYVGENFTLKGRVASKSPEGIIEAEVVVERDSGEVVLNCVTAVGPIPIE